MAWTSSIYDHFIIFIILPSSVTLTFNLPEQMFQKAILLLKENNFATMAQTSSIYDHFIMWCSSVTFLLLKENNCAKLFWNPCINV